jgi:ribosomal protein S18 acetylase RimI-like enzyme
MTESIVILPARLEWAESFRLCVDAVASERKFFLMTEAPPLAKIREFLGQMSQLGHPHYFAMKGSKVVGWCNVKRMEGIQRWHVGELSMGIHREHRGQGLGQKLVMSALSECRHLDYHKIELTVFADNARAIRLYESTGFEPEGRLKDYSRHAEGFRDAILMGQVL